MFQDISTGGTSGHSIDDYAKTFDNQLSEAVSQITPDIASSVDDSDEDDSDLVDTENEDPFDVQVNDRLEIVEPKRNNEDGTPQLFNDEVANSESASSEDDESESSEDESDENLELFEDRYKKGHKKKTYVKPYKSRNKYSKKKKTAKSSPPSSRSAVKWESVPYPPAIIANSPDAQPW